MDTWRWINDSAADDRCACGRGEREYSSLKNVQEVRRLEACAGKYLLEVVGVDGLVCGLAEHLAEVGGDGKIAAFVELFGREAGPLAVHLAATHGSAQDEHDVGVTVIGAPGAVLARCAAELRHGNEDYVFSIVAHVGPKGGETVAEFLQAIGQLSILISLILMSIPPADVGEGGFHAEVGLEQLGDLFEAVPERALWVISSSDRRVLRRIGGFEHPDGFEGFRASAVEDGVNALVVHGFKAGAHGLSGWIAAADAEVSKIADGDGGDFAFESAWEL
jgi:hypothetical protein